VLSKSTLGSSLNEAVFLKEFTVCFASSSLTEVCLLGMGPRVRNDLFKIIIRNHKSVNSICFPGEQAILDNARV
jgi:hypothetical protein